MSEHFNRLEFQDGPDAPATVSPKKQSNTDEIIAGLDTLLRKRLGELLEDFFPKVKAKLSGAEYQGKYGKIRKALLKEGDSAFQRITVVCTEAAEQYFTLKLFDRVCASARIPSWAQPCLSHVVVRLRNLHRELVPGLSPGIMKGEEFTVKAGLEEQAAGHMKAIRSTLQRLKRRGITARAAKDLGLKPSKLRRVLIEHLQLANPEWDPLKLSEEAGEIREVTYRAKITVRRGPVSHIKGFRTRSEDGGGDVEAIAPEAE